MLKTDIYSSQDTQTDTHTQTPGNPRSAQSQLWQTTSDISLQEGTVNRTTQPW